MKPQNKSVPNLDALIDLLEIRGIKKGSIVKPLRDLYPIMRDSTAPCSCGDPLLILTTPVFEYSKNNFYVIISFLSLKDGRKFNVEFGFENGMVTMGGREILKLVKSG